MIFAMSDLLKDSSIVDTFINYGVIGIIALVFIYQQNKVNKRQNENFQQLFDKLITDEGDTVTETYQKRTIDLLQAHNTNANRLASDILNSVSSKQDECDMLIELVTTYSALIRELKTCISKIKNNNSTTAKSNDIGEKLVEYGYIKRAQLNECRKRVQNQDLDVLDELSENITSIVNSKKKNK